MTKHMTRNEIRRMADIVVKVGNGHAQNLLKFKEREGYNGGVYGWNYDVYIVYHKGLSVAIITGYRCFGDMVDYKELKRFDDLAYDLLCSRIDAREEVNELLTKWVDTLI